MNRWAPWQQWAFGLLVAVIIATGAGTYAQMERRVELLEQRQVTVLQRLASLDAEIVSLQLTDSQSVTQRERIESKIDRLSEEIRGLGRR